MSSKEYTDRMVRMLELTGLVEPKTSNFGENRISILCRVNKENETRWIELITKILISADISAKDPVNWQCHICRHYFLKEMEGENKLVWGWNFSLQSREMGAALDNIVRVIKGQPIDTHPEELKEFPLYTSTNRNITKHGKGVHTIGGSDDFHWGKK